MTSKGIEGHIRHYHVYKITFSYKNDNIINTEIFHNSKVMKGHFKAKFT